LGSGGPGSEFAGVERAHAELEKKKAEFREELKEVEQECETLSHMLP
jgi:hypothetical protein